MNPPNFYQPEQRRRMSPWNTAPLPVARAPFRAENKPEAYFYSNEPQMLIGISGLDERQARRRSSGDTLFMRAFAAYLDQRNQASRRRRRFRRIGKRLIWGIAITLVLILLLEAAILSAIAIDILLHH